MPKYSTKSEPTTVHVTLADSFFRGVQGPYGVISAVLFAVLVGFLGVGVVRPDINPLALWLAATILICGVAVAVLGIVLDFKRQVLSDSFAHSFATEIFYIIDGTATVTDNKEVQSEAYTSLLVMLRRKNPGDSDAVIKFKKHMNETVRELTRRSLTSDMLQKVRNGIDAQKGLIDILPDE